MAGGAVFPSFHAPVVPHRVKSRTVFLKINNLFSALAHIDLNNVSSCRSVFC